MLASLSNVCEDRVIPHIFAEFLIFIALSSKASVMIQISLLESVIVFSIIFCLLGVGRGVRPVGALPPYLPTLLLTIPCSFHTPNINLHALRSTLLPFL